MRHRMGMPSTVYVGACCSEAKQWPGNGKRRLMLSFLKPFMSSSRSLRALRMLKLCKSEILKPGWRRTSFTNFSTLWIERPRVWSKTQSSRSVWDRLHKGPKLSATRCQSWFTALLWPVDTRRQLGFLYLVRLPCEPPSWASIPVADISSSWSPFWAMP